MKRYANKAGSTTENGSMAVLGAVAVVGALAFASVVVDAGYMLTTKADLQNVTDEAAVSANLELGRIYMNMGKSDPTTHALTDGEQTQIIDAVNRVTRSNTVAAEPVSILPGDLTFGRWEYSNGGLGSELTFTQTMTGPTAISVRARRDDQANGPVSTLMAGALGIRDFKLHATASGALTPLSSLPAGRLELPVGVSKVWYDQRVSKCGIDATIRLYPTNDAVSCAGWHSFTHKPASSSALKEIINRIRDGSFISPEVIVGQTEFEFIGGTISTALVEIGSLYDSRKDSQGEWRTQVPVYDGNDCSNPNASIKIVGIATVIVTSVVPTGIDKRIEGRMACSVIAYGAGGGPDYGTRLAFPLAME